MNIHKEYMEKHRLKESDFDNMPAIWNALNSVQEIIDRPKGSDFNFSMETDTKIKYPIGAFAPGYYTNKCISCEQNFTGDKYARQCEPCAINIVNESNTKALAELSKLRGSLEKIKFSNDTINRLLGLAPKEQ